jgi:hypothetical protein
MKSTVATSAVKYSKETTLLHYVLPLLGERQKVGGQAVSVGWKDG